MEELLGLAGSKVNQFILNHELISTHQIIGFHQQEQRHNDQNLPWLQYVLQDNHAILTGLFDGFPKKNEIFFHKKSTNGEVSKIGHHFIK